MLFAFDPDVEPTKDIIVNQDDDYFRVTISVYSAVADDAMSAFHNALRKLVAGDLEFIFKNREDFEQSWARFEAYFYPITAAGGIVLNEQSEVLFIRRKGKADLPKGKLDPGESPEAAANREVQEETGVQNLTLGEKLIQTYHIYPDPFANKREGPEWALKTTHWYKMNCEGPQSLVPQAGESITEAYWKPLDEINPQELDTFPNIRVVLTEYLR
jgi:8-oxo-dGTP pyrophosphatase MutT (NUDIX family)